MDYIINILIFVFIYTILSSSLNLIAGYAGLLSLAHAALFSVGAYVVALMALHFDSLFPLYTILGATSAGLLGVIIGFPGLRIRDDYFVVATFGFQVITFHVLNNLVDFTGGPLGLSNIPRPRFLWWELTSQWQLLLLAVAVTVFTLFISYLIINSPYGRILTAIRENEKFTLSLGKNIAYYKTTVFIIGANLAAIAGGLYAYYISYIDPTSFTVMESVFIISIVIVGGAGSFWGPVIGSSILVILPELIRYLGLPGSLAGNVRQMIYGALLTILMVWRPKGIAGKFVFKGANDYNAQ